MTPPKPENPLIDDLFQMERGLSSEDNSLDSSFKERRIEPELPSDDECEL